MSLILTSQELAVVRVIKRELERSTPATNLKLERGFRGKRKGAPRRGSILIFASDKKNPRSFDWEIWIVFSINNGQFSCSSMGNVPEDLWQALRRAIDERIATMRNVKVDPRISLSASSN